MISNFCWGDVFFGDGVHILRSELFRMMVLLRVLGALVGVTWVAADVILYFYVERIDTWGAFLFLLLSGMFFWYAAVGKDPLTSLRKRRSRRS